MFPKTSYFVHSLCKMGKNLVPIKLGGLMVHDGTPYGSQKSALDYWVAPCHFCAFLPDQLFWLYFALIFGTELPYCFLYNLDDCL